MGRRKKLNKEKESEKLTASIRSQSGYTLWRANPQDPYIYVSFVTTQLSQSYGADPLVSAMVKSLQFIDFKKPIIAKFKEIINQEWIGRAQLPIRFLPENASSEIIKNKNVCFIVCRPLTNLQELQQFQGSRTTTLHMRFPENMEDDTTPAQYKIIMFNHIENIQDITNEDIHIWLHETGHAFAEYKHFRQYDNRDTSPFSSLTCLDSVMGYQQDCPPVLKKEQQVFGAEKISRADPNPSIQKRVKQVINEFPIHLGPVDLEAAKEFVESWNRRNEEAKTHNTTKNKTKTTKNKNSKNSPVHEELYVAKVKMGGLAPNNETEMLDAMNQPQLSSKIAEVKPYSATTAEFPSTSNQTFSSVSPTEVSAPELSLVEWFIFGQLAAYFALQYFSFPLFSFLPKFEITLPWNRVRPISMEEKQLLEDYQATLQKNQSIIDAQRKSRVKQSGQYEEDFATIENLIEGVNRALVEGAITGADFSKIKTDIGKLESIIHTNAQRNEQLRREEIEVYRKTRRNRFWVEETSGTSEDPFSKSTFSPPR